MNLRVLAFACVVTASLCSPVFAQETLPPEQPQYRKWDVGGSMGLFVSNRQDFGSYNSWDWEGLAWNLEAGRYLTTHVKVEAGYMWSPSFSKYTSTTTYVEQRYVDPASVSAALTYQFFENVFAHPYVSVGVRTTVLSEEVQTCMCNPSSGYTFVSIGHERSIITRPFFSAGFKSYFNERVYVRPEILLAGNTHGISHSTLRLGIGFDF